MTNLLLSVSNIFSSILYIGLAIVVLLFMIMVHEFGHYTAGKLLKFKINEFSIGFGKAIFSKTKKNGEKFSLRIFPLGGFCAFEGEDEDKADVEGSFNSQKPWKRLIVLFMGAFFNFLSAIIFAVVFLMAFGYSDRVQVTDVSMPTSFSVQEDKWFKEGDVIYAVDGKKTNFVYDEYFTSLISKYEIGDEFIVSVYRNGKEVDLTIQKSWFACDTKVDETISSNYIGKKLYSLNGKYTYAVIYDNASFSYKLLNVKSPSRAFTINEEGFVDVEFVYDGGSVKETFFVDTTDESNIVISATKVGILTQNYRYGFFEAIGRSFVFCFGWAWKILIILWQLISGQLALTSLGGTVTTVVTIAQVTQTNIASLLLLIPLISINLSVFNLLPFPALDGSRMVFVVIEWIRGKPIDRKIEGMIHFIGLIVLFAFVLLVDILHFVL